VSDASSGGPSFDLDYREGHMRLGVALLLVAAAGFQWSGGTAWLPIWLGNMGLRFGLDGVDSLRVLIGLELTGAGLCLGIRRIGAKVAWACALVAAFVSLAELAALNAPGAVAAGSGASVMVLPIVVLAVAVLFLVAKRSPSVAAPQSALSVVVTSIIAFTAMMGIAARLPVENTVKTEAFANQGLKAIDLAFESWKGRTFADAGVAKHLPRLTAETLEGDAIVVFYNPKCGQCHEVFDRWLASGRSEKIIAVMVPAADGAIEAAGDGDIGDINCPTCARLELPKGPTWLITTPSVAVLKDGVIRCTADKDFTSCLGAPPAP
jgi:hypothetical protein